MKDNSTFFQEHFPFLPAALRWPNFHGYEIPLNLQTNGVKNRNKKRKKGRRKYDAEFKKEVVKMVESGRSVPDVENGWELAQT